MCNSSPGLDRFVQVHSETYKSTSRLDLEHALILSPLECAASTRNCQEEQQLSAERVSMAEKLPAASAAGLRNENIILANEQQLERICSPLLGAYSGPKFDASDRGYESDCQ